MIKKETIICLLVVTIVTAASFMLNLFNIKKSITANVLTLAGYNAYRTGAFDNAEVDLKKALKQTPGAFYTQYDLGNALYKQERYMEAAQAYRQALSTSRGAANAAIWNNLGNTFYQLGLLQQSAAAYTQALLLSSNDANIRRDYLLVVNKLRGDEGKKRVAEQDGRQPGNEKSQNGAKGKDDGKSDDDDKKERSDMSDQDIKNLFKLISQNEDEARGNAGSSKHKVNKVETGAPDY